MASSGSFTTSQFKGDVGTAFLVFLWEIQSQSVAKNSTTIKWTLKGAGTTGDYYYKAGNFKVVINGTTVYSSSTRIELYAGDTVASGTTTIAHKSDGTKTFSASAEAGIYTNAVNCEGSGSWELKAIPRYGTCKHSLNSKTETTIKMNWESDSTVDYIWYSKDNGSNWTGVNVTDGKSGTYTVSGLTANTAYKIKTRIRRKDSQLTTDSSALSVTTYDYPYCTSSPNFVLGDQLALKFYNPLGRSFVFYIIGNGTQIDVEYKCSGTEYKGVNSTETSVPYLYATIPSARSGKYKVKVVYNGVTKTRDNGNTYSIKESDCFPTFDTFTYQDTNPDVIAVTGSNLTLVKDHSTVRVNIPANNKMVAKNGATPAYYVAQLDTLVGDVNYSTNAVGITLGTPRSAGSKRITVRAYDSRGLSTMAYRDVAVLDYSQPVINATVTRQNNFEARSTVKISGTYSRMNFALNDKNTIKSVGYCYREKGGTWSPIVDVPFTLSNGTFKCNDFTLTLDYTKAFEFHFYVEDNFSSIMEETFVELGEAVFFIASNQKKCYLYGEDIAVNNNVRGMKYYTQLPTGADLNTYVEIGTYRSIQASHTDTMKNLPATFDGGFTLYVSNWTATPTNTEHRRQEVVYGRMTYVRRTLDGGATWTPWNTLALVEDIFPVGSVVCRSTKTNPSATYGGTWELVDKGFKSLYASKSNAFSTSINVENVGTHITLAGNTVRIRQGLTIGEALNDTTMVFGNFEWSEIGITALPMGYFEQVSYVDAGGGGFCWSVTYDTGTVNQLDVFNVTSIPSGKTVYLDLTFPVDHTRMLDSYCDKFYYKRTS